MRKTWKRYMHILFPYRQPLRFASSPSLSRFSARHLRQHQVSVRQASGKRPAPVERFSVWVRVCCWWMGFVGAVGVSGTLRLDPPISSTAGSGASVVQQKLGHLPTVPTIGSYSLSSAFPDLLHDGSDCGIYHTYTTEYYSIIILHFRKISS